VRSRYYGRDPLHPTGPALLGIVRTAKHYQLNEDIIHPQESGYIMYRNKQIVKISYPDYYTKERPTAGLRYNELWVKRRIYKWFLFLLLVYCFCFPNKMWKDEKDAKDAKKMQKDAKK